MRAPYSKSRSQTLPRGDLGWSSRVPARLADPSTSGKESCLQEAERGGCQQVSEARPRASPERGDQATRRQGADGISDANHAEDSAIGLWVPSLPSLLWLCMERGARRCGGGRGTGAPVEGRGTGSTGSSLHPTPTARLSGALRFPGKHLVKGQGWSSAGCSRWRSRGLRRLSGGKAM
uniref:Uncharacterized protein n=1 Tax=Rangifer tarandus platyrhynchus TaxID=3082113 RepID=A0ACB0EIF2_RANTA|nr:unnamed protein product [Rangifer tarandus platyrhynchus]